MIAALGDNCPQIPILGPACKIVTDPAGTVAGAIGNAVSDAASGFWGTIASGLEDMAKSIFNEIGSLVSAIGHVDLGNAAYQDLYSRLEWLALVLAVSLTAIAVVHAAATAGAGGVGRVGFRLLFVTAAMPCALIFVDKGLQATDSMTAVITEHFADDITKVMSGITGGFTAASGIASGLMIPISLIGILVGIALWIELAARSAGIYFIALFLPFSLSLMVFRGTARWAKLTIGLLIGMLVSKPIIATGIALAGVLLGKAGVSDVGSSMIVGLIVLGITAFVPYKVLQMLGVSHHLGKSDIGQFASPSKGLAIGTQVASFAGGGAGAGAVSAAAASGGSGGGGGGGSGGGGSPAPAPVALTASPKAMVA